MDFSVVGLIGSAIVGAVQVLQYVNARSAQKEAGLERYAKADIIQSDMLSIRNDINSVELKLVKLSEQISELQLQNAVCDTERDHIAEDIEHQIKLLDKLNEKLDTLK